ncbi:sodium:solute symporter family protein [Natronogracilivirga saccharolytica]|uniref:Sodium:solute symporter family protein n=1 Tax=Natronogracilivirga saccharolytica TaxID=2812953 RepID=A0A8J7RTS3_9BACT|nr:sodium:solute symporter family protein [Natronogracilivirga saccharolytica]
MHGIDFIIIAAYFTGLLALGFFRRGSTETEQSFLLSGRTISLPAFVATLVSTWYGGILGVGEYSYQFGISQWVLFGLPYYVFALLFAVFLAGKIRENKALTIPEALAKTYKSKTGNVSAVLIFLLVSPAPYILMLGMLFRFVTGSDAHLLIFASLTALFSVLYVSISGFRAVIRTDILQFALMFIGFIVLIALAIQSAGPPRDIWSQLSETHQDPLGGHNIQYLLVWFFIALWTFVDPSFHQRAAAAKTPATARKGIFLSVGFWFLFDILTVLGGLYGFVILGEIDNPVLVYPELGAYLLPAGLSGIFFLTLLATIMSTLDSFLLISGQTIGRDLAAKLWKPEKSILLTRCGMLLSAILGIILIVIYPSVVTLWYVIGSVLIPGLLFPVLGIYLPVFRLQRDKATLSLIIPVLVSSAWMMLGTLTADDLYSYAFLGLEPFYPGLISAAALWYFGRQQTAE